MIYRRVAKLWIPHSRTGFIRSEDKDIQPLFTSSKKSCSMCVIAFPVSTGSLTTYDNRRQREVIQTKALDFSMGDEESPGWGSTIFPWVVGLGAKHSEMRIDWFKCNSFFLLGNLQFLMWKRGLATITWSYVLLKYFSCSWISISRNRWRQNQFIYIFNS